MSSGDYSRLSFDPEKHFTAVLMQQGRVQVDADWNEQVEITEHRLRLQALDIMGQCVVPNTTPHGFEIRRTPDGHFTIGAGRVYVDGLMAENHGIRKEDSRIEPTPYSNSVDGHQPYQSDAPALPDEGPFLFYIDVWQREVTHLEYPDLVEKAVGIDTTTRLQTAWQVKVLAGDGIEPHTTSTDFTDSKSWQALIRPSDGRLSTKTSHYNGFENRLYRVEIHQAGGQGEATFKWSRDNAAIATAVIAVDRNTLTVTQTCWDHIRRFNRGDWIEITDDRHELCGDAGLIQRIKHVDDDAHTIEIEHELNPRLLQVDRVGKVDPGAHARIRLWDQKGQIKDANGQILTDLSDSTSAGVIPLPAAGVPVELEHGIQIVFETVAGGRYHVGDFWIFAVRAKDNYVECLDHAVPRGIQHHYGGLALFKGKEFLQDCRVKWPPPTVRQEARDTTVYVTEGSHSTGHFTIQNGLDRVKSTGGTVQLGSGRYVLAEPLWIRNAKSIHFRGQGANTIVECSALFEFGLAVFDSAGIVIENLAFARVGQALPKSDSVGVLLTNCSSTFITQCHFAQNPEDELKPSYPQGSVFWDLALGVGGRVSNVLVRDNFLAGTSAVGGASQELMSALGRATGDAIQPLRVQNLCVRDNIFWCRFRGNVFEKLQHKISGWWWCLRHCRRSLGSSVFC